MAAARIQRWALLLGAYKYKLQYKPGKFMLNADALSRLPQSLEQELQDAEDTAEYVLVVDQWDEPAVPMEELQALTQSDGVLSSVCKSRATGDVNSADSYGWNFAPGDPVYLRNYGRGDKWTPGMVRSTYGARIVSVDTENGLVHRHMDQLRRRSIEEPSSPEALASPQISLDPPVQDREAPTATGPGIPGHPPPELRRSTRIKKPEKRYGF
ncbi:uncharacterized protein LOC144146715 [Haemaphysalis longicornis]